MNFGKPEFYHRLRTEFYSDNNWEIHLLLFDEVQRMARQVARTIEDSSSAPTPSMTQSAASSPTPSTGFLRIPTSKPPMSAPG